MSENHLEKNEAKLESAQESLETLNNNDDSHKLFYIVVEELRENGYELPNDKIEDIREMHAGNGEFVLVRFKDNVSIMFNKENDEVITQIKGEQNPLSGSEAEEYRQKYYSYTLKFIETRNEILKEGSLLAKRRLEKMGI